MYLLKFLTDLYLLYTDRSKWTKRSTIMYVPTIDATDRPAYSPNDRPNHFIPTFTTYLQAEQLYTDQLIYVHTDDRPYRSTGARTDRRIHRSIYVYTDGATLLARRPTAVLNYRPVDQPNYRPIS